MTAPSDKHALRRLARQRRRGLSAQARARAEAAVAAHLHALLGRHQWQGIAAYAATASELDLSAFFADLPAAPVTVHLPAIDADGVMRFRRWPVGTVLTPGPHGIAQPPPSAVATMPADLDAILLPLLAFDDCGTRLGSGAGYYDRALASCRVLATPSPPMLVGVAFEAQRLASLPREPWDIPLDGVVTEQGWQAFAHRP